MPFILEMSTGQGWILVSGIIDVVIIGAIINDFFSQRARRKRIEKGMCGSCDGTGLNEYQTSPCNDCGGFGRNPNI